MISNVMTTAPIPPPSRLILRSQALKDIFQAIPSFPPFANCLPWKSLHTWHLDIKI